LVTFDNLRSVSFAEILVDFQQNSCLMGRLLWDELFSRAAASFFVHEPVKLNVLCHFGFSISL